jgi:pimeloyl-ACP methyl ester carboxylesterase
MLGVMLGMAPAYAQTPTPTRFSVEVIGQGPDVIFIPGLGSSRDVWARQAADLRETHRVHLVQLAGFAGEPAPSAAGEMVAPFVEELARYIADNNIDRPAIIGHSMGGFAGLMLARRHPDQVGRLMIVDALPFYSAMFGPQVTSASVEPQARAMRDQIVAMDSAAFAAQQAMGMQRLMKTESRRGEAASWTTTSDRRVFAQAMYEVMTTDLRADVESVTTPLTVVYAYDPVMGPEVMVDGLYRGAYASASNVSFARIDGSFHFVMIDQPDAFAAAVDAFLR